MAYESIYMYECSLFFRDDENCFKYVIISNSLLLYPFLNFILEVKIPNLPLVYINRYINQNAIHFRQLVL